MKNKGYQEIIHRGFEDVSQLLFNELKGPEQAVVNVSGEDSIFVRFNQSKVRQNIQVEQAVLHLQLQNSTTTTRGSWTLSGNSEMDIREARLHLARLRQELSTLPEDPHLVSVVNNGQSSLENPSHRNEDQALESILSETKNVDMVGLYAGGPVFSGNKNSAGQSHWFSSSNFFFDYSLYDGAKAVKSVFAGREWSDQSLAHKIQESRNLLSLMKKPQQKVAPGNYRVYLAPGAVAELLRLMGWNALSQKAFRTGQCPFRKFVEGNFSFSPLVQLCENFDLGWSPRFNSWGEVSEPQVTLVKDGKLQQLLTNSKTAQEYKITANAAAEWETPRSLDLLPGELPEKEILHRLERGLYISNLHYLNWSDPLNARFTGMTRFACFWVERGEILGPIQDLRFDETFERAFGRELEALTSFTEMDPGVSTYGERELGGRRSPGMLISQWNFTL